MLNTEHEIRQTWGGHAPILGALVKVLQPRMAVECGCGKYSTGILLGGKGTDGTEDELVTRMVVTIEHDATWAERMKGELGASAGWHEWIVEGVPGIDNGTARQAISAEVRADLDERYARYARHVGRHDLLFVDTFTAARVPAIVHLGPLADVIVIHDTEKDHPVGYGLGEADEVLQGMWRYSYQPHGMTAEWHEFTWTEVFSRKELDFRGLTEAAAPAAMDLWGQRPWLVALGMGPTGWVR